jgi:hypothetical protein
LPICSGLDGCISISAQTYKLNVSFTCENKTLISFYAQVRVLPNTPFDLIIGRKTIKENSLALLT